MTPKKDFASLYSLNFGMFILFSFFLNTHQLLVEKFSIETALRHKGTQNIDCTWSAITDFFFF